MIPRQFRPARLIEPRPGALGSTARQSAARSAGFTFIEIFVVMTIIGILAGTVVLHSIGADHDRNLETEARRIAALVELARAEAVTRNESWGLFVDETRYGFKIYDEFDGSWRDAPNNTFRTRNAPPDVAFSLQVEGLSRPNASSDPRTGKSGQPGTEEDRKASEDLPRVLILASGEQTPFLIGVRMRGRASWSVTSDGISRTRASSTPQSDDQA